MNGDFVIGLQVTALGMALVFLTLIIVMLAIMLLGRILRPQAEAEEPRPVVPETNAALGQGAAALIQARSEPAAATLRDDGSDEAAAIMVALMLERAKRRPQPRITWPAAPEPVYEDLPGEAVTIISIDAGPSIWRGQGRVQAMQ